MVHRTIILGLLPYLFSFAIAFEFDMWLINFILQVFNETVFVFTIDGNWNLVHLFVLITNDHFVLTALN